MLACAPAAREDVSLLPVPEHAQSLNLVRRDVVKDEKVCRTRRLSTMLGLSQMPLTPGSV